jgi:hypothetical protein
MDYDGMCTCTRVYAAGCAWAPTTVPYHHRVMSALVPRSRGIVHAYLKSGSPRVGWLDA